MSYVAILARRPQNHPINKIWIKVTILLYCTRCSKINANIKKIVDLVKYAGWSCWRISFSRSNVVCCLGTHLGCPVIIRFFSPAFGLVTRGSLMAICWLGTLLLPMAPPLLLSIIFYSIVLASTFSVLTSGLALVPIMLWLLCKKLLPSLPTLISLVVSFLHSSGLFYNLWFGVFPFSLFTLYPCFLSLLVCPFPFGRLCWPSDPSGCKLQLVCQMPVQFLTKKKSC